MARQKLWAWLKQLPHRTDYEQIRDEFETPPFRIARKDPLFLRELEKRCPREALPKRLYFDWVSDGAREPEVTLSFPNRTITVSKDLLIRKYGFRRSREQLSRHIGKKIVKSKAIPDQLIEWLKASKQVSASYDYQTHIGSVTLVPANLPALYQYANEHGEEPLKSNCLQYCRDNRETVKQDLHWEGLGDIPDEIGKILFPGSVDSSGDDW